MRDFSYIDIIMALIWAARWTLLLSVVAFVCGGIAGFLLMLLRISPLTPLRYVSRGVAEIIQGTPLLIQFLLAFFGLSILGIELSPWTSATLALTAFTSAFLSDIWRGAVESIPVGQWEAARAMSFNYFQQLGLVILPQAVRLSIAPTVGFLAQVIKGTSLASAIGFVELARSATNITNVTFEPFFVYLVTAVIYFAICFPISVFSRRLEKSLAY
ncbi:amino acid ABC transporter permease [Leptolyngbya iicbica]|uniref:Amino acid ABC transporter permease n=2 Tax=Cyanophyceae TaxID=3028117 RepID=A0A4Q7EAA5_9CYAN|nr:amino acid ABC transporter permease [Leptolyngbya sp. LK]RZM79384.1 amino acid ABC transporter permease [Leptolyngbya sp. LK]